MPVDVYKTWLQQLDETRALKSMGRANKRMKYYFMFALISVMENIVNVFFKKPGEANFYIDEKVGRGGAHRRFQVPVDGVQAVTFREFLLCPPKGLPSLCSLMDIDLREYDINPWQQRFMPYVVLWRYTSTGHEWAVKTVQSLPYINTTTKRLIFHQIMIIKYADLGFGARKTIKSFTEEVARLQEMISPYRSHISEQEITKSPHQIVSGK